MARFQPKPQPSHPVTCPHRPVRHADRRAAGTSIHSLSRAPPDRGWSFLLAAAPLSVAGGVGSPANAIALR
jgi:hypothetical protein